MAISQNPITGRMKGTSGSFTFKRMGDNNIITSHPDSTQTNTDPCTPAQLNQRALFKYVTTAIAKIEPYTNLIFPAKLHQTTIFAECVKLFLKLNTPDQIPYLFDEKKIIKQALGNGVSQYMDIAFHPLTNKKYAVIYDLNTVLRKYGTNSYISFLVSTPNLSAIKIYYKAFKLSGNPEYFQLDNTFDTGIKVYVWFCLHNVNTNSGFINRHSKLFGIINNGTIIVR